LRTSSSSQSANKKQEFVKTSDKKEDKKSNKKKRDMSRVKCYNYKKEGHFAKDCKKAKVKDYEYYKTKMLLAKKDKDKQVLLAEDQAWMESSSDSDQEINENMVFMAKIEKILSDSEASSSSVDEKISEVSYYLSESESESEYKNSEYYDNTTNYARPEPNVPLRANLGVLHVICSLHLCYRCSIFVTRGTSPKILKVVVNEVCKGNYTTTLVIRLLPNDTRAQSGLYTTPSSIHRNQLALLVRLPMFECFLGQLARSCSNHDSELEVSSVEKTNQNAEKIKLWFDHQHLFQTSDMRVRPSDR
nr:hypothetical protein [Tanacetum cinerariifolium]